MPRRSSALDSAKMLRGSSSTRSTVRPTRSSSERVEPLQHVLLFGRQVGDDAVQEQRRLVEQPLRRFDALDHDAARHGVQLRVLLGRQFAAGEDHDRNVGERRCRRACAPAPRSPTCPAGADRAPRNRTDCPAACSSASLPVPALTISMSSWPSNSRMLICSAALSSTINSRLRARLGEFLDARRAPRRCLRAWSAC